jgi:pimeloyl-ACP methyl ester carboxylesterase
MFSSNLTKAALLLAQTISTTATALPYDSRPNDSGSFGTLQQSYYPPTADCVDYMIPVDIVSSNMFFNFTKWNTDFDLEDFLSIATTRASANFPGVLEGPTDEAATFNIAASFCEPKVKNGKEKTVILATHGIGPARSHWNSPFKPEEHNFVQAAIAEGYSVFFYDRLGCGASQK